MANKKKALRRKLRRLRKVKPTEKEPPEKSSKADLLMSSMEALIRKMTMTPPPATIIPQQAPAPMPPTNKQSDKEITKEEILTELTRQRELDLMKSQMNYVYDVITGDIEARREKGEILAKMKVNNSSVSPKDYGVKESEEMFKNQLSKAKVEKDIAEIKEHNKLDEKEQQMKANKVYYDEVVNRLKQKIADNNGPHKTIREQTALNKVYKIFDSSDDDEYDDEGSINGALNEVKTIKSPPKQIYKPFITPRAKILGTPPKQSYYQQSKDNQQEEQLMEIESESGTQGVSLERSETKTPSPIKVNTPPQSPVKKPSPPLTVDIAKRKADVFVDEAFESSNKKIAKEEIKQFEKQLETNREEEISDLYNTYLNIKNKREQLVNELLNKNVNLSPEHKLELAKYYKINPETLKDELLAVHMYIGAGNSRIRNARSYTQNQTKEKKAEFEEAQQRIDRMKDRLKFLRQFNVKDTRNHIAALELERDGKKHKLIERIRNTINFNPQYATLLAEERVALQKVLKNEYLNRYHKNLNINVSDLQRAQEALGDNNMLIEQRVQEIENNEVNNVNYQPHYEIEQYKFN